MTHLAILKAFRVLSIKVRKLRTRPPNLRTLCIARVSGPGWASLSPGVKIEKKKCSPKRSILLMLPIDFSNILAQRPGGAFGGVGLPGPSLSSGPERL